MSKNYLYERKFAQWPAFVGLVEQWSETFGSWEAEGRAVKDVPDEAFDAADNECIARATNIIIQLGCNAVSPNDPEYWSAISFLTAADIRDDVKKAKPEDAYV